MGLISKVYDNPYAIYNAERLRESNAKRAEKSELRKARRRAAKDLRKAAKKRVRTRRSAKSSGFDIPLYFRGMGSAFYLTREWRELRYKALRSCGARCQCCGSTEAKLHVDHIKPRSRFPGLELQIQNLQVLCADCNLGKGAWDSTDWRSKNGAIT